MRVWKEIGLDLLRNSGFLLKNIVIDILLVQVSWWYPPLGPLRLFCPSARSPARLPTYSIYDDDAAAFALATWHSPAQIMRCLFIIE